MPAPHPDLFDALDIGLTVWRLDTPDDDRGLVLVAANPAATDLLAAPEPLAGLAGGSIDEVLPQARLGGLPTLLAHAARDGHQPAAARLRWVRPDGREVIVSASSRRLPDGSIALAVTDATDAHRDRERLVHLARHDPLTGLPNRAHFQEAIERALARDPGPLAVVVIDLDRFKDVNDTLGHRQGDILLSQVGSRLERQLSPSVDLIARLGGDEFGVLATRPGDPLLLASRVAASFAAPFELGHLAVRATASVGVAVAPDHGDDVDNLLRRADIAMYAAKRSARGTAVYRPEDDRFNLRRLQIMSQLRDAIRSGRLTLAYQPKVDLMAERVVGAEALVRWHHEELGELAPGEFIPLAEETGLIGALTGWVLNETGRQCREWLDAGIDLELSANISARNLYDPGLVRLLTRIMGPDGFGLRPGHLTLELTETQVAEDLPMARIILKRLQAIGARLSIDDFGTGYSSLSYLSRLPLDELKIDRSFVGDMDTDHGAAIVQSIIGLGHDLGLDVVAEGVESTATWSSLAALGCDVVQGNHLTAPLPARQFQDWLAGCPYEVGRTAAA